ncbi:hypothetical protein AB0F77_27715 [Streptomyces sp. NPDC026672]|uniref:hypothetical protein n=1 Tax=unclassified Streptomyces TaxID=2593676 RepID=UPI00340EC7B5
MSPGSQKSAASWTWKPSISSMAVRVRAANSSAPPISSRPDCTICRRQASIPA